MIAERATCGHFAVWDEDGNLVHRICSCPDLRRPVVVLASGAVAAPKVELIRCPNCPGFTPRRGAPHAPRMVGGKRVDCSGKEIAS